MMPGPFPQSLAKKAKNQYDSPTGGGWLVGQGAAGLVLGRRKR